MYCFPLPLEGVFLEEEVNDFNAGRAYQILEDLFDQCDLLDMLSSKHDFDRFQSHYKDQYDLFCELRRLHDQLQTVHNLLLPKNYFSD